MARASESETAVRNYLLFLADPAQLIDPDEASRLEMAAQSAADPLEKLRAINRLKQLREGNGDRYREDFCAHAKRWAEANDIRPATFLELGVDESTLRAAGFRMRGLGVKQPSGGRRRPSGHRPQVRVQQVKDAVAQHTGQFTLADVAAASGASPMTIRKAIEELVAAGDIERLGPTPNWAQPGRAPILYRPATKRARRQPA